jgi:hypothetical protein
LCVFIFLGNPVYRTTGEYIFTGTAYGWKMTVLQQTAMIIKVNLNRVVTSKGSRRYSALSTSAACYRGLESRSGLEVFEFFLSPITHPRNWPRIN